MGEYHLQTPISTADVSPLSVGDIVYVTGMMVTARDGAHRRVLEYRKNELPIPIDFSGVILYHCGPLVKKVNAEWQVVAAGPTTSMRMEPFEDEFMSAFDVRIIVGKGGMGPKTTETMQRVGGIYCAVTGGTAVLAAGSVRRVEGVHWLDLGMPEALWLLEVEKFGPLVVTIDSYGRNLYEDVMEQVNRNLVRIYRQIDRTTLHEREST